MTTFCNTLWAIGIAIFAGIVLMIAGSIFLYILACVLYFYGDKGDWDDDNDPEQENDGCEKNRNEKNRNYENLY